MAKAASGEGERGQASSLAARVALLPTKADDPGAAPTAACEAYFATLESQVFYAEDRYGWLTGCLTTSWSATGALECFDSVNMFEGPARDKARESLQRR